jgi:hypothetical protein
METFEEIIKKKYFSGIKFSDQRELNVFYSYLRGFSLLFLDSSIKNILETVVGNQLLYLVNSDKDLDGI